MFQRITTSAVLILICAASFAVANDNFPGKVLIRVTEAETGQPIAGAKVFANLGIAITEENVTPPPEQLTDANGRYELAVPLGNLRMSPPILPAGYWPVTDKSLGLNQLQQFVVPRQQPVVEKHFEARKGVIWPIKVATATGTPLPDIVVHTHRSTDQSKSLLITDSAGQGQLTLPSDGGELSVGFSHQRLSFMPRPHALMKIEPGFDPLAVASQSPIAAGRKIELTDRQGHKCMWEGCSAVITNGAIELIFEAEDPAAAVGTGEFAGNIVDHLGQPIVGAHVLGHAPGLDWDQSLAKTDERGGFHFRGLSKTSGAGNPAGIHLIVKKDGYAGIVSDHLFVPNSEGLQRLEKPLVLQPGYSLPLRILDEDDQPVEGAWIEGIGRAYRLFKSDEWGRCIARDVPEGPISFRANYGDKRAEVNATVSPGSASESAVIVRLAKAPEQQTARPPRPKFPKVGELAPEWTIREWTDGKERTLASLRGRFVVLDFWSLGCTPCLKVTLPVENELQHKFAKDVTFIYIHPADTEIHLIRELLQVKQWNLLVGLDQGMSHADSQTVNRYGVWGYGTEVIIDREGRIVYHSNNDLENQDQRIAKMKAIAEEIGLPWPIEKDADQEEIVRRLQRYHTHWLTKELEKVLAK